MCCQMAFTQAMLLRLGMKISVAAARRSHQSASCWQSLQQFTSSVANVELLRPSMPSVEAGSVVWPKQPVVNLANLTDTLNDFNPRGSVRYTTIGHIEPTTQSIHHGRADHPPRDAVRCISTHGPSKGAERGVPSEEGRARVPVAQDGSSRVLSFTAVQAHDPAKLHLAAYPRVVLCRLAGLPLRDLRCIDPAFKSQYPVILVRPACILVSLFDQRAIITAREVLVFDPEMRDAWVARPRIPPLARILGHRLQSGRDEAGEGGADGKHDKAGVEWKICRRCGKIQEVAESASCPPPVYATLQSLRMAHLHDRESLRRIKSEERGLQSAVASLKAAASEAQVELTSSVGELEEWIAKLGQEKEAMGKRLAVLELKIKREKERMSTECREQGALGLSGTVTSVGVLSGCGDESSLCPSIAVQHPRSLSCGDHEWDWRRRRSPLTAASPAALIQRGAPEVALPFELRTLEVILDATCRTLGDKYEYLKPDVERVLDTLEANVKQRRPLQQEEQTKLMGLKTRLLRLQGEVGAIKAALEAILENDEDMSDLYLTAKAAGSPPSKDQHEEAEELLENAARRVDDVESLLSQLMEKMSFREEHMRTMLDSQRNELLRLDVRLNLGTFSIAAGGTVAALFGMNLMSGLEENPLAFLVIAGSVVSLSSLFYSLILRHSIKKRIL